MRQLATLISLILFTLPALSAEDDRPSPHRLFKTAEELKNSVNALAKNFKSQSTGKKWGRSPGHKSLYRSFFTYRNELQTVTEMCKPGAIPDRLLEITMHCQTLAQRMDELAQFVMIEQELRQTIQQLSKQSVQLTQPVKAYEIRYFAWKKAQHDQQLADQVATMSGEISALQQAQYDTSVLYEEIDQAIPYCEPPTQIIVNGPGHRPCPPPVVRPPVTPPVTPPICPSPPRPTSPPACTPPIKPGPPYRPPR